MFALVKKARTKPKQIQEILQQYNLPINIRNQID